MFYVYVEANEKHTGFFAGDGLRSSLNFAKSFATFDEADAAGKERTDGRYTVLCLPGKEIKSCVS